MLFASVATAFLSALAAAAPATPEKRTTAGSGTIYPIVSQYNVFTGAVTYNTGKGYIFKAPGTSPSITTLLAFTFPADTAGKMCSLRFPLDGTAVTTGSQRAQVFSSLKPAEQTTDTWPDGNLRDQHQGDLFLESGVGASWEATYGPYAQESFPCPAGSKLGLELVGRWDSVEVSWDQSLSGPYIEYH